MKKEDFIENILNSTNGITKVSPNDELLSKIHAKLEDDKPADGYSKWLVAASILILISLNIGILSYQNQKSETNSNLLELVNNSNNQLY